MSFIKIGNIGQTLEEDPIIDDIIEEIIIGVFQEV